MILIDTNNTFRAFSEKCSSGLPLREYFEQAFYNPADQVFVFDGPNALERRRSIFPGYKVGRQKASDNFYLHLEILRELLSHSRAVTIRMKGWEADDIIAHIAQDVQGGIIIDSTDKDFLSLVSDRVSVPKAEMKGVAACDIPLYKVLVGDPSDKIPGIPGFGQKSWAGLTQENKRFWKIVLSGGPIQDDLGLKGSHQKWAEDNIGLLRAYNTIVNFFPVNSEDIVKNMCFGEPNYAAADKRLREIYQ